MHTISFQTFFVWALLWIVHETLVTFEVILLQLQSTCTVPTASGRPHGRPFVLAYQWTSSQPLSSPQLSHNDSLWAKGISQSHGEQGLDFREAEELSWCSSWSNSLWERWSCGLAHCPAGNATDPIWTVLTISDGISSWTPWKPQHNKVSDCIFEIHQLWQSGFSRVYLNSYCSCLFEPEIIKISQSSHKIYSNNLLNFQESMTISNTHTKKVWKLIVCPS